MPKRRGDRQRRQCGSRKTGGKANEGKAGDGRGSVGEEATGASGAIWLSGDVNEGTNGTDEVGLRRSTRASDDRGLGRLVVIVVSASSMISVIISAEGCSVIGIISSGSKGSVGIFVRPWGWEGVGRKRAEKM